MNSKNSVIAKLNLNKYPSKLILNKPEDIDDFNELDYDSAFSKEKYDLIFIFVFNLEQFGHHLQSVIEQQALNDDGYLYFAYPKKNNPQYEEFIERDSIIADLPVDEDGVVRNSRLKFSRMVSLNEVFTIVGLKSQAEGKKRTASAKCSQCVDDYIEHISGIRQYLESDQETLAFYNQLTPGYQKDWARYVYSAKRSETQEKRLGEMKEILAQGYKSIDLYRRREQ
ncbi:YdeI/OmpD-associated family protein [Paenibacillus apii]|uniref:YdeI/OmpD-associated family protein n=1 Tax=Paenibacillus apii TaxID=1850370 RepID=UPI00143A7A73|nr:YdeI/OmpD-associated family protein [Paenibacillus apii]NJJ41985.1 YdeI/OmpD-associated family protein [Paenibacillus apii]